MKKLIFVIGLFLMASCVNSKVTCEAYSYNEADFDISKSTLESQKKYQSYTVLK